MDTREHWERVYRTKMPTEVSWYAVHLGTSLRMIEAAARKDPSIIDVGGGESEDSEVLISAVEEIVHES